MSSKIRSNIERQVMASVGVIYTARALTSVMALKIYALILSVWGVGRLVWVSKVFENFFAVERVGLGAAGNYVVYAVGHTNLIVQFTLLVAACAFIALCVDFARSFSSPQLFRA